MKLYNKVCYLILYSFGLFLFSCHGPENKESKEQKELAGTPVTITSINTEPLTEYTELNATSTFLQKNYVKAITAGYIKSVNTELGKAVNAGQTLFVMQTKEAQSIGNSVSKLDPSFKFSGIINIKASGSGFIAQLNHQVGDYVQDGEQLAVINDVSSFAFLLNLPYELKQYLQQNAAVELLLPDGSKLKGTVSSAMPTVDPSSQIQSIIIKVPNSNNIPENLIAKVRILKVNKENAISLPKQSVLTNDVQSDFWVMKMIDSNTAVHVSVKTGMETKDRVEILAPKFEPGDKIVLTGNYGLPDTAKVEIVK